MIELISFGNVLEVVIRTTIIFLVAFIVIRIRGTKQLAQLTLFDILIVIALGSAVGDVMIYPEEIVSLMRSAVAVSTLAVLVHVFEFLACRAPRKITRIIYGDSTIIIKNGRLIKRNFERTNLTEDQLKAKLREKNIQYYSEAKIVRLEPDGQLSIQRKK
ncbi:MAG: DUF421 domain-containing protein [candidate division WOR-3 bacterium]|jgi:uncharacterized membrane protein YcaP (DUF421 family)